MPSMGSSEPVPRNTNLQLPQLRKSAHMHTKHGLALEPVQLFLNLIATQCRVSELLGQCCDPFVA